MGLRRIRTPRSKVPIVVLVATVLTLALAGAAQSRPTERAATLDKIVYGTGFGVLGRDAFVHVAVKMGYYRDEGIELEIQPGAGTVDSMRQLVAGRRDIGFGDVNALVLSRANEGLPVKAVYLVSQDILSTYIALKESGISTPKDLEGKTIADPAGSTTTVLFPLYAKKAGVDASKVTFVPSAPPTLPSLLASKRVDVVAQFILGLPLMQAAAGGKPVVSLPYFKYFPGFVGTAVLVSDDWIARNPGLLRRFLRATDKGLRYALSNPGRAGAILNEMEPLANPVVAAQELKLLKPHARTPFTVKNGFGAFDRRRINSTISIMTNFFKPKNRITADEVYDARFLPGPPKKKK
jgi:NitT/TauT family transport system substrate-binding protein